MLLFDTDDICYCDVFVINKFFFRNNKTENNLKNVYFVGQLDNKNCVSKIDTDSDISMVNKSLVAPNKIKYELSNYNLRYPEIRGRKLDKKIKFLWRFDLINMQWKFRCWLQILAIVVSSG